MFDVPRYMRPYRAELRRRAIRIGGLTLGGLLALGAATIAGAEGPAGSRLASELPAVAVHSAALLLVAASARRGVRLRRAAALARRR